MALGASALAGCVPSGDGGGEVDEATTVEAWQPADDYTFTLRSRCGETNFLGRWRVTVTGGEVAAVEGLDHRATSYLETWGTDDVPSLQELIEDAARAEASPTGAATITRAEGGRPERIEIDPVTSGIDDEACYEIEAYDPAS